MQVQFFLQHAKLAIKLWNLLLEDVVTTESLGRLQKHLEKCTDKNPLRVIKFQ